LRQAREERVVEHVIHNDYRQQPITSDEAKCRYQEYLARLEAMIADQEDVVLQARAREDEDQLASARTSLWRLLTKRQGLVDALDAYERARASA
jgi:hypothetical protein